MGGAGGVVALDEDGRTDHFTFLLPFAEGVSNGVHLNFIVCYEPPPILSGPTTMAATTLSCPGLRSHTH